MGKLLARLKTDALNALAALQWAVGKVLQVLHNIGVAIDYGASMLLWLHEEEPMTISTRCDLACDWPREAGLVQDLLRMLAGVLDFLARGPHCREARIADIKRARATITRCSNPSIQELQ